MPRVPVAARGLCLLALVAGCGRETSAVSGKVNYDGRPLASGYITFSPQDEGTSRGAKVVDGAYRIEDLFPGSFRVLISTPSQYVEDPKEKSGLKKVAQPTVPSKAPGNQRVVQLRAGDQTLDFDVKKPS